MGHADITVQRLALKLRDAGAPVHTLRARVEDALRISAKPAALAHRFVRVRRLRMCLPREASAQRLALWLEREWRRLERLAEPIDKASDEAAAVWAVDEAAARLALLRRWLRDEPAEAWYWRRLVPGTDASVPLARRIERLLFAPIDSTGPQAAVSMRGQMLGLRREALRSIDAAGCGPPLVAALGESQRAELRSIGWPGSPSPPGRVQAIAGAAAAVPASAAGFGAARAAAPAPAPVGLPGVAPGRTRAPATRAVGHSSGCDAPPRKSPDAALSAHAAASAPRTGTGDDAALRAAPHHAGSAPAPAPAPDGETTAWAGLWFLLPLLMRHGIDRLDHAAAMLDALLRRAAARHRFDGPSWRWIEAVAQCAAGQSVPVWEADAWWRETRIACLRQTRLPLRRLMLRSGHVWIAPHRVDVLLPLTAADIRIRRAGLDIDPGFLPWLDTVIRFHYA